jgi:hypothetical protein
VIKVVLRSYKIARMIKKLVPKKVTEAEQVKEAKTIENPNDAAEKGTSPSQSVKRKGVVHKTFARKKRKIIEESSSDYEKAEEVAEEKEQEKTLVTWYEPKEPGVLKTKPLATKHPIISYTFKIRGGSEGY